MADWKMPMSYNYNPSYHAYAYGLMYSQGPEQTHHQNMNMSWTEAAYGSAAAAAAAATAGVTGGFYSSSAPVPPPPPPQSQSPPGSPLQEAGGHYPNSVAYYADSHTQNGRLFLSHNRLQYDQNPKEPDQGGGSDTPSDSEAHTPDSWSSGSSREGGVPHPDQDQPNWLKKDQGYENDGSPDIIELSGTLSAASEELTGLISKGPEDQQAMSTIVPSPPEQLATRPRKAKARTAFSEVQMNALTDRFNVQRYLTPAEMKTLAGFTGLTYKQVKTWFQNRRMKLKRHQKDNSWVSDRYITPGIPNGIPHSQFQIDGQMLSQELYSSPQLRDAVFKKSPPHPPSFYPSYTRPVSPSSLQGVWPPLAPALMHYEPVSTTGDAATSAVDPANSSPTEMTAVHSATQWSS